MRVADFFGVSIPTSLLFLVSLGVGSGQEVSIKAKIERAGRRSIQDLYANKYTGLVLNHDNYHWSLLILDSDGVAYHLDSMFEFPTLGKRNSKFEEKKKKVNLHSQYVRYLSTILDILSSISIINYYTLITLCNVNDSSLLQGEA